MTEPTVLFEKRGAIGVITLNRPDGQNTITAQMAAELREIRARVGWDSGIGVFLLTARGADFSIGTDPESFGRFDRQEDRVKYHTAAAHIASIDQPVIAAIDGAAFGQGLELALACDVRICSEKARFSMERIVSGGMPFDGGTQRLPRLVGRMKALELILCRMAVDAQEAKEIGLVNRVVPQEALLPEALKLAEDLAAKGPIALRYAKETVMKGMDMTLSQGLRLEADLYFLLHATDDRREGIEAFRGKRSPKFEGK